MASYRKRTRKNGAATFQITWRENGRQMAHTVDTESEAELWVRTIEATGSWDTANKVIQDAARGSYTITDAVEDHIRLLVKPTPQTIHNYWSMLENHIKGSLGAVPVADLTEQNIAEWVRGMQRKDLSAKTIRNVHGLMSAALERCVPRRIPSNPCHGVDLPTTERAEDHISFLTYDEFMKIHSALPGQYKTFALFLVVTGARFGEATAVTAADVALTASPPTVRISKAWKRMGSSGYKVGPPKTASSKRTIALGDVLAGAMKPLLKNRAPDDLVFVNARGERINQAVFYRVWQSALREIRSVDETFTRTPRVHDLRHTSASWLIQSGYDLFKVARRLGHANTSMVDRVYGHLMPEGLAEGARHMDSAMRPSSLRAAVGVLEPVEPDGQ